MIVRRHLTLVLTIVITLWAHSGSTKGERWSRQILNSEWIPLANPRSLQGAGNFAGISSHPEIGNPAQVQPLALPPALRDQYHQQLLQLQETQESIQKLLQLQQQLRAQQQLLQAQSFLPEGFSNDEERKAALHQSTIANIQTLPHLTPGALLPPPPGDQPQPPEFGAQDFHLPNARKLVQLPQSSKDQGAAYNVQAQEEPKGVKNPDNISADSGEKNRDYTTRQGGHFKNAKQLRGNQNNEQLATQTTPSSLNAQNEGDEEVQLLYVPAETLAQRDQQRKTQRGRSRKQHVQQQQQQQQELNRQQTRYHQQPSVQNSQEFGGQGFENTRPSTTQQQTFAHQVLYQLQEEQAKRTRQQQEDREKEVARLREEQNELERQAKLHQERVFREQDARRQKELALRKELERQEEEARQKELQRLKEVKQRKQQEEELARKKEAERQEELERQKIAEIIEQQRKEKEAEARQAEIDRLAALERQKELEIQQSLKQQQELERQQAEDEARARAQLEAHRIAHQDAIDKQRQAQIDAAKIDAENRARNQAQQQHLTETTRPKNQRLKTRPRQKHRQDNKNAAPSPNQPPLSVYMGSTSPVVNPGDLKVSDVLTILKNAKTISVLDSVGPDAPQVFVGPTNLAPPNGYAKFDLPYLSTIDNNRVERKVDKLPFFVAPLSFKPPPGYSKIPFPAPHIGSVVVNNLDNEPDSLDDPPGGQVSKGDDLQIQPMPDPLIEPNSYTPNDNFPTVNPYVQQVTPQYSPDPFVSSTTPRYETSYSTTPSSSGTRYRHRQFYNDRPPHVVSTSIYQENSASEPGQVTRNNFRPYYREEQGHGTSSYNNAPTSLPQIDNNNNNNNHHHHESNEQRDSLQPVFSTQVKQKADNLQSDVHHGAGLFNPSESQGIKSEFGVNENNREHSTVFGEIQDSKSSPGPTLYTIASELPRISSQLPGLVNSLYEQQREVNQNNDEPLTTVPSTTPSTTTTTSATTTTEPSTTTYRSRGRQRGRVVPTRAPTTTDYTPTRSSSSSTVNDRSRRPSSRSRVRQGYATTTEAYQEPIYEPTKSKFSGVEEKTHYSTASETQNRPAPRNQRYRGRGGSDRNAVQPEARPDAVLSEVDHNAHNREVNNADNPLHQGLNILEQNSQVQISNSAGPVYREDVFNNNEDNLRPDAQPLQGAGIQQIQGLNYHQGFRSSNFGQSNVEDNPVNGFNYQSKKEGQEIATETPISHQQYTVESFNGQPPQNAEQIYSFHGIQASDTPGKPNVNNFQNADLNLDQIYPSNPSGIQHSDNSKLVSHGHGQLEDLRDAVEQKTEFLETPITTTEAPIELTTPRPTLTPAPLIVRQRVRGRLNQNAQRPHVDAAIQTRPTGSRDEFVRFSAVNQDVVKQHSSSSGRINHPGNRQRIRNRGQINQQANIQTEGNDFVRIQPPVQRTTTTTTTTTIQPPVNQQKDNDQDIEYGFIRPPSFKPVHPVANAAPNYRPKYEQVQTEEPTNDAPVEIKTPQSHALKNRGKYQVMNRRPLTRSTVSPPPIITSTESPIEDEVYTVRPKVRNEQDYNNQAPKTRGRVRRPGKRRTTTTSTTTTTTTTTTESILDSSNELPLDENYPNIIHGLPVPSDTQRQTLFQEELKSSDLETLPRPVALQRPGQLHSSQHQENSQFPRSDFVLNFGVGSEDGDGIEEYDQTQLASSPRRKYSHINRATFQSHAVPDIEGAESQWSPKLTHSSFQPSSLVNRVQNGDKNKVRQEKGDLDTFDIITAGPDLHSVDVVVTANNSNAPRDIVVNTSYLGNTNKKESDDNPVLQGRSILVQEKNETFKEDSASLDSLQFWNNGENDKLQENQATTTSSSVLQDTVNPVTDLPKSSENSEEPATTKRTVHRRRRVRIRVRPTDDFVSAESQHVSSAWNNLLQEKRDHDKTNRFDEFKTTSGTSVTPIYSTTTTTEPTTVKSFFQELIDEMTKTSDVGPTTTTTDIPNDDQSTVNNFTKIPEQTETPSTNVEDLETTIGDKFVTEATTERPDFVESTLKKKVEKSKTTEMKLDQKEEQKIWVNHNYEGVTEREAETTVSKLDDGEASTASATTTTTVYSADKDSGSESHSFSDYVNAFFKNMGTGETKTEKEKIGEIDTTTESISPTSYSGMEEEEKADEITSKTVQEEELKKETSNSGESTTLLVDLPTSKTLEETTSSAQELTFNLSPSTTPEVPLSPQELTTDIPTTTTPAPVPIEVKQLSQSTNDLSKILRTSTTTEISHMTEICYRGRCVKTKSRKEVRRR